MSKIFYFMGKSAAGKDTIFQKIQMLLPELRTVVIYTTRPIREGEEEGVAYHFVTEDQMREFERDGKIIELRSYDTVHGIWYYFTADDGQFSGENPCVAIGTLESFEKMQRYFGKENVIPVYIQVDDGIRLERALARERTQKEPKYAELCRRFLADEKDFSKENLERLGIGKCFENRDMEKCTNEIMLYIKKNLCYNSNKDTGSR